MISDGLAQVATWLAVPEFDPCLTDHKISSFFSISVRLCRWLYFFSRLLDSDPKSQEIMATWTPPVPTLVQQLANYMVLNVCWMWLAGVASTEGIRATERVRKQEFSIQIAIPRISYAFQKYLASACALSINEVRPVATAATSTDLSPLLALEKVAERPIPGLVAHFTSFLHVEETASLQ